jgi:glutamate 5-kinase
MRLLVKIGSNLLQTEGGDIDLRFVSSLAEGIKAVKSEGHQVIIVSSGAVLCGVKRMNMPERPTELSMKQTVSAVGQAYLMHLYDTVFSNYGLVVGQVLLTSDIFKLKNENRFINAKTTLENMLALGIVPVINENDAVAVSELVFGDNDFLSVYVSYMLEADLLVMLSTAGGLRDNQGNIVGEVRNIEEALKLVRDSGSSFGTGGMRSKLEAAKLASLLGIPVVIAGKETNLLSILEGSYRGTYIKPSQKKLRNKQKVIAMLEEPEGIIFIDEGAVKALKSGKSLLPAGILGVDGIFPEGSVVSIADPAGNFVGKGKVNFSSEVIKRIRGLKGYQVKEKLKTSKEEVIHRDNLILF